MTVRELKDKLEAFDEDAELMIWDNIRSENGKYDGTASILSIHFVGPDDDYGDGEVWIETGDDQ